MATTQLKKVTGVQTPDGQVHDTIKAATEHVRNTTIKTALEAFADSGVVPENKDTGFPCVGISGMAGFLFDNREALLKALQPEVEVRLRKPRAPKATKEVASAAGNPA